LNVKGTAGTRVEPVVIVSSSRGGHRGTETGGLSDKKKGEGQEGRGTVYRGGKKRTQVVDSIRREVGNGHF